ncbi:kinase-like domain-containing protein [Chytridium lagenaria]|nr:kinase-like domain-containing protein [Chytridium lagenaria]
MGNAVSAAFTIGDQVGSGGPGNLWKIRTAVRKSNGQSVSIFIFDKNFIDTLNPLANKPSKDKKELDKAHEVLKKEAQTLSRLRHPSLLEVTEALDDSKTALAFGAEPVLCCLSNVLGNFYNAGSLDKTAFKAKYDLDELEIQKGLLQVIKVPSYFHAIVNTMQVLNFSIRINGCMAASPQNPSTLNAKGDWKISGFNFSYQLMTPSDTASFYVGDYPPFCSPSMDYLAPEVILDDRYGLNSDLWSLGCLIYAVFNSGSPPFVTNNNTYTFKQKATRIDLIEFDRPTIPIRLRDSLRGLLVRDPGQRLSLEMFQKSEFFDNILISTIGFLEGLVEKTQVQKAQFLKGLVKMLPQFSEKLLTRKILPILLQELKDTLMTPFILPNIFWISDHLSDSEFNATILPALKPLFKIADPPQSVLLLLSRIDLLMKKASSPEIFRQDIMPLIYGALDLPVVQVQEQAAKMVPTLVAKLDFTTVKSVLFPKLQNIYMNSNSLSVRVSALIAIHSTVKLLDKVGLLAVYAELARHLDKEMIATEILPELWRLSIDQVLNVAQFKKFMKVIHELTARVEDQHTKVLQEMKTMEVPSEKTVVTDSPSDFASLVRGVGGAPEGSPVPSASSPSKTYVSSDPPYSKTSSPVQATPFSDSYTLKPTFSKPPLQPQSPIIQPSVSSFTHPLIVLHVHPIFNFILLPPHTSNNVQPLLLQHESTNPNPKPPTGFTPPQILSPSTFPTTFPSSGYTPPMSASSINPIPTQPRPATNGLSLNQLSLNPMQPNYGGSIQPNYGGAQLNGSTLSAGSQLNSGGAQLNGFAATPPSFGMMQPLRPSNPTTQPTLQQRPKPGISDFDPFS